MPKFIVELDAAQVQHLRRLLVEFHDNVQVVIETDDAVIAKRAEKAYIDAASKTVGEVHSILLSAKEVIDVAH